MRQFVLIGILILGVISVTRYGQDAARAADTGSAKPDSEPPNERLLFPVRYLEPKDLAEKLESIFNHGAAQTVKIAPMPDANCLIISAPKNALSELVKMLDQLDQAPKVVAIDVWVVNLQKPGERIDGKDGFDQSLLTGAKDQVEGQLSKLSKDGRLTVVNRFHTTALSNRQSFEQQGARVPRITASTLTANGRVSATTLDNVGSLVTVTPKVMDDGRIKLELNVEKSYLGSDEKGVVITKFNTGEEVRSPRYFTLLFKNEVVVPNGQVVKLEGTERPETEEDGSFLVLVAAEVQSAVASK
jgi:type II secretory pathway component GspD/PulD (secretin)